MNNKELKPCPFCGCTAKLAKIENKELKETFCGVICLNASCIATDIEPSFTNEEKAIAAWNRRASA